MSVELTLRVLDTALALFWVVMLWRLVRSGYVSGQPSASPDRTRRPGFFWLMAFIFALMVFHFAVLAWIGQKLV